MSDTLQLVVDVLGIQLTRSVQSGRGQADSGFKLPRGQRARPARTHINRRLKEMRVRSGGSAHCRLRELIVMTACPLPYSTPPAS